MTREESKILSIEKSNVVIEYLQQILSDSEVVKGKMNFGYTKIENNNMCTLDIYVPIRNFERHLNMGITLEHCDIFYEQLFNDLLDNFLEKPDQGVSGYYQIMGIIGSNFNGISAINQNGSRIDLNFCYRGQKFKEIVSLYDNRIHEYLEKIETNKEMKKIKRKFDTMRNFYNK